MVGGAKMNLVFMNQMNHEPIMEMVLLKHHQQIHGEARKEEPPQPHLWGVGKVQRCIYQYVAQKISAKEWKPT